MPVSGNEEMGVKDSVGQFSEYSAGIPIKKRRFPFISSHSQPTEDSPSLPTENESEQKGFSCLLQGSTVSNDSVVAASSNPRYVVASLNTSGVLVSSNTSGVLVSSNTSTIYADGIAASLNATSSAASSNASGAAVSSTVVSVAASLGAGSVAASSNASSVATSSNTNSVAARLNAGSLAASSNAFGVATSSTAINVAASLNAGSLAASSNAFGVATSSTAINVAASLNAGSFAASSNAFSVATSSTAISVAASSNACSVAASSNASGVAMSSTAISVAASSNAIRAVENPDASSVAASVSGFSDASEKSVPKKEKSSSDDTNGSMVQANTNLLRVELEEENFTIHSRSLANIGSKGKLVASEDSDNILRKSVKSEPDLGHNDSLTLNVGKDIYSQKNGGGEFRSQLPTVSENPGLSLGLREYPLSVVSGNNEQGFQNQEKTKLVSLNLSLNNGECSTQSRSTDVQPNTNENGDANMLADRTNWDLNTTMDSWEGVASDDAASKTTTRVEDIKRLIISSGMTATDMPIQRQILQEIERRAKIEMLSIPSSQQYRSKDSLCLGRTMPFLHLNSNEKSLGSSAKVDSWKVVANMSSPAESVPISKPTMLNLKPVKSEPLDEIFRSDSAGVKAKPMGLLNVRQVKCELIEKCISESSKSSILTTLNSVDAGTLKPEPVYESNRETRERMEGSMNQSDEQMLRPLDTTTLPTSTDSSSHGGASTHVEHFIQAEETVPGGEGQVASTMISSAGHDVNESNIPVKMDNTTSQSKKVEDPGYCRLKSVAVEVPDSGGTAEGSISDEEKINLSGDILGEDSYGFDYDESDDKQELTAAMDVEHDDRMEDDFEDGEVREPVENTEMEVPICERREAGTGNNGDTGYRNSDFVGFVGDNNPSSSSFKEKETQREGLEADKEACLQESSAVEMPCSEIDKKVNPRKSLDVSGNKDTIKGKEGEQTSIQATDTSQGTSVTTAQGADDIKTDSEGKSDSVLSKGEAFSDGDDAGEDVDNRGSWGRIINLSQASNLSSAGRTRSISGRTLQLQVGRERLPNIALEGDKFHPRGRDEAYVDGSHRVSRERHHVRPYRYNRISFMRGRGRHMRGFADDHAEPVFARCQPPFEGLDGPFVRGNRGFTSVQRMVHPRTCSKSPTRPRTRSCGPWSSLRRSPDVFGGPLELPHRRSPIYRMERISSPDRPCFAGEMVIRRHGSPPYLSRASNGLRDLDPGRDQGHPTSCISSRSPSGRILVRNHRRLDLVDPRERNDGDDYFGGPIPSVRFHELGTDGNADERRRYSDRRGPVRPFRPPYGGADSENFHLNAEGGPRSFRFYPEEDPELHERGNMREREFNRRIQNRPANAPRKTRNIVEQEGTFRHGGRVWHDNGFDDMSQVKRKRL